MAIVLFVAIGVFAAMQIKGDYKQFFVAGRTLSLPVTTLTLASQCIDSNAVLGNADLSYRYHFWDGAVLPLGLGLSLILNGIFLARHMNRGGYLTLPDVYGRAYGPLAEIIGGTLTIVSFLALLAGNLVGCGTILAFLFNIALKEAIVISGTVMFLYTASGGILSVAYSDIAQSTLGITAIAVCGWWCYFHNHKAPPDSIGFPGYAYPDGFGSRVCSKYDGVACEFDENRCCYNTAKWCDSNGENCERIDNGAYWWKGADDRIFDSFPSTGDNSMLNPRALWPFPNAIFWNWSTIVILAFGNLAAIDFQARCMAAKTEKIATTANFIAGCLGIFVGLPLAFIGGVSRFYYGPDSIHARFEADTCSRSVDFPTCAQWLPDPKANLRLLTHEAPNWLGAWTLIGIVAASMSTSDGAILAMSTVASHNLFRKLPQFFPFCLPANLVNHDNLLFLTRIFGLPCTIIAMLIGSYAQSDHAAGATGYLLIVAFDIVLAGCVAPIFFAFYVTDPSPRAGLFAMIAGTFLRVVLEFTLPKDGNLILPFKTDEFLDYGKPQVSLFPTFFDQPPELLWTPGEEQCPQKRLRDFTGVDSLAAPLFSIFVFFLVHLAEKYSGKSFNFLPERFAWMLEPVPYEPTEAKPIMDLSKKSTTTSANDDDPQGTAQVTEAPPDDDDDDMEDVSLADDDEVTNKTEV